MNETRMAKLINKKENQRSILNSFLVILISVVLFGSVAWFLSDLIPSIFDLSHDMHDLFY